jgi:hypothetical protein
MVLPRASAPLPSPDVTAAGRRTVWLAGMEERLGRVLARPVSVGAVTCGLALAIAWTQLLPGVNASAVYLAALSILAAALLAAAEGERWRISFSLFAWAFAVRLLTATACWYLAVREGGPFLGPDSSTYYRESAELAALALRLDALPVVHYGTYDVAQYYLFAGAIRYVGADLFGLQVLNCGLLALAAALTFGFSRMILPRGAVIVGALTAFHPSLIVISAVDLLKDPSIIFGTTLLVWALIRMTRERRLAALGGLALAGLVAALYLRTGRFYTFAYLEGGYVAAGLLMAILGRRVYERRVALALTVLLFALAEGLPMRYAWPPAPLMVADTVAYALGAPGLRYYAFGLFDRVQVRHAGESPPPAARPSAGFGWLLSYPANLVRRMYGPFIWILPSDWRFRHLQANDYLLYPGMLVWYALIPAVVAGLVLAGARLFRSRDGPFGIALLWFFTVVYFAQYLAINLSYRQRDVMVPVLLVFAWGGVLWAADRPRARCWYLAYWAMLLVMAAGHLAARRLLGA